MLDPGELGKAIALWIAVLCLGSALTGALIASLAWAFL